MDHTEITAKVIQCVAESLARSPEEIQPSSSLVKDLGADSLDFLDIMFALERTFSITVGKEQFDLLKKVGLTKEEAIQGANLTPEAISRLRSILPAIPESGDVPVITLRDYIRVDTIAMIVESLRKEKGL